MEPWTLEEIGEELADAYGIEGIKFALDRLIDRLRADRDNIVGKMQQLIDTAEVKRDNQGDDDG